MGGNDLRIVRLEIEAGRRRDEFVERQKGSASCELLKVFRAERGYIGSVVRGELGEKLLAVRAVVCVVLDFDLDARMRGFELPREVVDDLEGFVTLVAGEPERDRFGKCG